MIKVVYIEKDSLSINQLISNEPSNHTRIDLFQYTWLKCHTNRSLFDMLRFPCQYLGLVQFARYNVNETVEYRVVNDVSIIDINHHLTISNHSARLSFNHRRPIINGFLT